MKRNIRIILTAILFSFTYLLAWQLKAENVLNIGVNKPPHDDSKRSTVRVNTMWVRHNLSWKECISRASTILAKDEYFVDLSSKVSTYGLKEGMTVSFRCDYEGVAFIIVAYRKRPNQATQDRIINGLAAKFISKN